MRLYTTTGATEVNDPTHGTFKANPDGSFDLPNELSERLHGVHVNKKSMWEDDEERVQRVTEEQLKSVRDPAALYSAVKEMSETQRGLSMGQNVLLAAVVKALGLDIPGMAAAPAAPAVSGPAEDDGEESDEDPASDGAEEPEVATDPTAVAKLDAPAKVATAPIASADPSAIASKPARGARKSAASSSAPSA